jgi:NAD(P)-dependent dehydrogenase (short-subunit alcohol dehydrogenase family)
VHETNGSQRRIATNFPPEVGKLAVVTTSTSGIGFEIALALARAGADVIVTGKHSTEGHEALARIRSFAPDVLVRFEKLDLENLGSVRDFARRLGGSGRPIDLLINNACTLMLSKRELTADGFERHLAMNFLGHFALTANLLPLLRAGKHPRVVSLTSTGRHHGEINFDDLHLESGYTPLKAYSQSKLATLIFSQELQRKSDSCGWGLTGNSAQPIGTKAAQISNSSEVTGTMSWYRRTLGFSPEQLKGGVLQALLEPTENRAGQDSAAVKGLVDLIGPAAPEAIDLRVLDQAAARRLWETAAELTATTWPEN